ncbi:hypothetical protein [Phenylobacterium sp.]|jgi:hypothetical protein|uniref:hypothetical protein n=1 Tax=Phenylobacterium sp. TaxID=1871053 RepID=UPI000C910E68|nr:hypothetical protein [Phenylobacterium sp.]MAK81328.1 hypothetical protein [Phenylobacterium sp.]|tara:strand:+ start:18546 stop:19262 length:717 start_codon:yes stop_codon:yes gene_type:complete
MSTRSTIAKGAVAAVAGVATLAAAAVAPTAASAQSYGYYGQTQGNTYYDPCRRDQTNRSTAGALIGGALGAVIGSNAAAGGVRTEGALLGGALGAAAGAAVGNRAAACAPGYDNRTTQNSQYGNGGYYDQNRYGQGYGQSYGQSYGHQPQYQGGYYQSGAAPGYYGSSYDSNRYGYTSSSSSYGQAYDRYGRTYSVAQRPSADGCSIAESPIYMPDGSTQKRFVRVCRDNSGRYQVVD